MENKKKWIEILNNIEISKDKHKVFLKYIEHHVEYELKYPIVFGDDLPYTTLPLALKVLSKLDNINKIHFVDQPTLKKQKTNVCVLTINLQQDGIEMIPYLEEYMSSIFIDETVTQLNKILETNEIYIYVLFADIKTKDKISQIFHRYYINK